MNSAVIGLGFGDEGKGLVTEYLCSKSTNPLVVRYSGGQQAGHTVVKDGVRHIFSNFGSGTLSGIPTYWSKFCTVDPIAVTNELHILQKKGITPKLYIDYKCPITTPYDAFHNQACDKFNGTCGVGVGTTIAREENYYSLLIEDLRNKTAFHMKLDLIGRYYGMHLDLRKFLKRVEEMLHHECIVFVNHSLPWINKDNFVLEGSQGLLLDQNIGFFPHVSRGNTGTKNILSIFGDYEFRNLDLYLVTRAYQTRHGNGPMTNEDLPHNIKLDPDETNITNAHQGPFRRSLLDIDLLRYALYKDEGINKVLRKTLVITCLDHIKNEYRFTHKGDIVNCRDEEDFIIQVSFLLDLEENVLVSESPYSNKIQKF